MEINKLIRSRKVMAGIAALFGVALLAGAFSFGVAVGFHKARFSYEWGEHYDRNFGGPRHGLFGMRGGPEFMDAHGTFGTIIRVEPAKAPGQPTVIIMKGRNGVEEIILVSDDTSVRLMNSQGAISDLKVDSSAIVIGEPNDQGQIQAKFIRLFPSPSPSMMVPAR